MIPNILYRRPAANIEIRASQAANQLPAIDGFRVRYIHWYGHGTAATPSDLVGEFLQTIGSARRESNGASGRGQGRGEVAPKPR